MTFWVTQKSHSNRNKCHCVLEPYSVGHKQRLSIAEAMFCHRKLLICSYVRNLLQKIQTYSFKDECLEVINSLSAMPARDILLPGKEQDDTLLPFQKLTGLAAESYFKCWRQDKALHCTWGKVSCRAYRQLWLATSPCPTASAAWDSCVTLPNGRTGPACQSIQGDRLRKGSRGR